jgi:hypothetical protein
MKDLYAKLSPNKFKALSIACCASGDIAVAVYLYFKFAVYENFIVPMRQAFDIATQANPTFPMQLSPALEMELFGLIRNTVIASIALVFVIHGLIYLGFWLHKGFSYYYVKMLAWLGPVFCLLLWLPAIGAGDWPMMYFFIQMFLFLFVAVGLKYFPLKDLIEETKES